MKCRDHLMSNLPLIQELQQKFFESDKNCFKFVLRIIL